VVPWLCHRERSDPILSPSVDHSVPARGPRARRRAGWSNDRLSRTTSAARRPQSRARRRPASTAMAMVGHRTKSIYRRYAIVDETMLREGAERLTAFYRGQSPLTTVVPLRKTGQAKKTRPVTRASRPERGPQASLTTSRCRNGRRDRPGMRDEVSGPDPGAHFCTSSLNRFNSVGPRAGTVHGPARPSTRRLLAMTPSPTQRCIPLSPRYRQRRKP